MQKPLSGESKLRVGVDMTVLAYNREGIGNFITRLFGHVYRSPKQKDMIEWVYLTTKEVKLAQGFASGVRTAYRVAQAARRANCDILLSTHSHLLPLLFPKTIWLIHDLGPVIHPQLFGLTQGGFRSGLFRGLFRKAMQRTSLVVTTSETMAAEIRDFAENKEVIALGSGLAREIHPPKLDSPEHEAVMKKYHLAAGNYFFSLNTISPRKNVDVILKGYIKLCQNLGYNNQSRAKSLPEQPKLVISGKTGWDTAPLFDMYREAIARFPNLNLSVNVIFTGFIDSQHADSLMADAKALVYASSYEGFGLSPLEAVAMNTEVIISDISVFREIYNGVGHFFTPLDADALAQQMEAVLKGEKKLTRNRIDAILAKYNWQNVSEKLENAVLSAW